MRCVHWTPDYFDGLVIIAMLQASDIDARLFGENFVRQNWFKILAYDGFRVMAPTHQITAAHGMIVDFQNGVFALPAEETERAFCPECRLCAGETDLAPRRRVFLTFIVANICLDFSVALLFNPYEHVVAIFTLFLLTLLACLPIFIRHIVIGCYRCTNCSTTWRQPADERFSTQQMRAEAASDLGRV